MNCVFVCDNNLGVEIWINCMVGLFFLSLFDCFFAVAELMCILSLHVFYVFNNFFFLFFF